MMNNNDISLKSQKLVNNLAFIDTHAHLDMLADTEAAILRAKNNNIEHIIAVGIDINSSIKAADLALRYPGFISPTIGIHPSETEDLQFKDKFEQLVASGSYVAIGEIGLDFFKNYTSKEKQFECFRYQMELAQKYKLPVILHNRHADAEIEEILQDYPTVKRIFHCYSSNLDFALKMLNEYTYFSFTGMITYAKKGKVIQTIRELDISKILIETDCPYLTPQQYKGADNEPLFVIEVAEKIAKIKDISLEQVAKQTTLNAKVFFNIS